MNKKPLLDPRLTNVILLLSLAVALLTLCLMDRTGANAWTVYREAVRTVVH